MPLPSHITWPWAFSLENIVSFLTAHNTWCGHGWVAAASS